MPNRSLQAKKSPNSDNWKMLFDLINWRNNRLNEGFLATPEGAELAKILDAAGLVYDLIDSQPYLSANGDYWAPRTRARKVVELFGHHRTEFPDGPVEEFIQEFVAHRDADQEAKTNA